MDGKAQKLFLFQMKMLRTGFRNGGSWECIPYPIFSRMRSEGFPFIVGGLGVAPGLGVGPVFASNVSCCRLSSFVVVSGPHVVTIPCLLEKIQRRHC